MIGLAPRQKATGITYLAHAVGAGKSITMAITVMKQHRLGLVATAMLVVPGHCLARAAREFWRSTPRPISSSQTRQLWQGQAAPLYRYKGCLRTGFVPTEIRIRFAWAMGTSSL